MRVMALSTAGVLVKNESTGNYSFMYVSHYFLAYKREGDRKWRRYHRNDVSVTVRFELYKQAHTATVVQGGGGGGGLMEPPLVFRYVTIS